VYYSSNDAIGGFQFNVDGIISAIGGAAEDANFTVSTGGNTVLGFSFSGASIPAGEGVLTTITVLGSDPCLTGLVISSTSGITLDSSVEDCITIVVGDGFDSCASGMYDCAGVCDGDAVEDCAGECGGTAVEDECNVCDGDGTSCQETIVDVYYSSNDAIGGFQFNVDGIISAIGGAAEDANFTVSTGGNTVLGFSFSGASIPAGEGVLTTITVLGSDPCLTGLVISSTSGITLDSSVEDCITIVVGDGFDSCASGMYDCAGVCDGDAVEDCAGESP
jgi:hypothetical protein